MSGTRRRARWYVAGLAILLVAAGAVALVANPFAKAQGPSANGAAADAATAMVTVARRSLSSQTQVDGTLGYAGPSTIALPAGTAPADVEQAQQALDSATAARQTAEAGLAADEQALAQARAQLEADRAKRATDCAGDDAASAPASSDGSGSTSPSTPCATAALAVTTDEQAVTAAEQKVLTDQGSLASARVTWSGAEQGLSEAEASALTFAAGATYTGLPSPGSVLRRGSTLYEISSEPVLLLYGSMPAWRAFRAGMAPGRDVAALNTNLRALGYGAALAGDTFSALTEDAIKRLQTAHGLPRTGELLLGSVVFKSGPVRVKSVVPTVGSATQAGPVLAVTSTRHQITVSLDASQQEGVKAGDKVVITLPDNSTTTGSIASVGRVATAASGDGGGTPTIDLHIALADQARAGHLDQAPVEVSITTASVEHALVVPVDALLALAGGGYGVEAVDAAGVHQIVGVTLGLFDDADGLVQVTGSSVRAGQKVVVPAP